MKLCPKYSVRNECTDVVQFSSGENGLVYGGLVGELTGRVSYCCLLGHFQNKGLDKTEAQVIG